MARRLIAGIDLSGRTRGVTALAWLEGTAGGPRLMEPPVVNGLRGPSGDELLLDTVLERSPRPRLVAIDAPLALPHAVTCPKRRCSRCFPKAGPPPSYTRRRLESKAAWTARGYAAGPMPMVMIAAIAFRAIYLKRALEREGLAVVETWPMGVYRALELRSGRASATKLDVRGRCALLANEIGGLAEQLNPNTASTDQLDAVAAALAGWADLTGDSDPIRDTAAPDEGQIVVPRNGRALR